MLSRSQISINRHGSALSPRSGVLAVVQPHIERRSRLASFAHEMVAARMAVALRENPPQALQLALMQAYQRGRRVVA